MVRTDLEKSLKIEKLWDIREKSLNLPQKSLNIFESSLGKHNLRLKKKIYAKELLEAQRHTNFLALVIMKVFSYDFGVLSIVHISII